ncbi:hypothetical protein AAMO2058_000217100 [Amorphochlora amoebiformis]
MASHRRLDRLGLSLVAFGDMGYRVGYHRRYTSGRKEDTRTGFPSRSGIGSSRRSSNENKQKQTSKIYGLTEKEFCFLFLPKPHVRSAFKTNQTENFEIGLGNVWFISHPCTIPRPEPTPTAEELPEKKNIKKSASEASHSNSTPLSKGRIEKGLDVEGKKTVRCIVSFNVVFSLPKKVEKHPIAHSIRRIARNLALALKSEELRCGYLSAEIRLVQMEKERVSHSTLKPSTNTHKRPSPASPIRQETTRLGYTLDQLLTGLLQKEMARVRINGWMGLDVTLCRLEDLKSNRIRPHHTLLLGDRVSSVLRALPPGASPALIELIKHHDPTKSFQELARVLCMPLDQLLELANHLVVWRLGKIVPAIKPRSIFGFPPDGTRGVKGCAWMVGSSLSQEFEATFQKKFGLVSFLALFNRVVQLRVHLQNWTARGLNKKDLSLMLRWAVNKHLLVPFKRYLFFFPPTPKSHNLPYSPPLPNPIPTPTPTPTPAPTSEREEKRQQQCEQPRNQQLEDRSPTEATGQRNAIEGGVGERKMGLGLGSSGFELGGELGEFGDESKDFRLLRGLYRGGYLNGEQDVDEILWQWNQAVIKKTEQGQSGAETISRRDIMMLTTKYPRLIVSSLRPAAGGEIDSYYL